MTVEHFFMCLLAIGIFDEMCVQICFFFVFFLTAKFWEFFIYFEYKFFFIKYGFSFYF